MKKSKIVGFRRFTGKNKDGEHIDMCFIGLEDGASIGVNGSEVKLVLKLMLAGMSVEYTPKGKDQKYDKFYQYCK